ncbi:MAG: ribosomal L7Ae/L30e/S12e/Gadd45 family protein [Oscillospiraceae bacterium]|nr:ribosomal L7Ae/L30e/S12e/Gadd45 family protein [Oscillospiraceae bacterium]
MTVDNGQLLSYLGLCRAASLCSFGHDAAKSSLRSGKARLCLLCEDASPRLAEEFIYLAEQARVPLHRLSLTAQDIKAATQYKAAVITVNDKGFAEKIAALM